MCPLHERTMLGITNETFKVTAECWRDAYFADSVPMTELAGYSKTGQIGVKSSIVQK